MEEYDLSNRKHIKEGIYWVFDKIRQSLVIAEYSNGNFYYYSTHDAFSLTVDVTHYKKIAEPRAFERKPSTARW